MIESLLQTLETASWLAPAAALLWGLASVLLSPCHLTSVPLLVGFLARVKDQPLKERVLAGWVTVGISLSLVVLAGVSLLAGRILGDLWGMGPWLMILFLLLAGLYLLGAFELPTIAQLRPERVRAGSSGAIAAGGVLGLTLGPCTFSFFTPLLAFGMGSASLSLKVITIASFVGAHLAATWSAGVLGARFGGWLSKGNRISGFIKALVGVGCIALAIELIMTAP